MKKFSCPFDIHQKNLIDSFLFCLFCVLCYLILQDCFFRVTFFCDFFLSFGFGFGKEKNVKEIFSINQLIHVQ